MTEAIEPFDIVAFLAPVENVLEQARGNCGRRDLLNAADQMGRSAGGKLLTPDDADDLAMILDLAMFEVNDRGTRPFDRFLSGPARTLSAADRDIAEALGKSYFSLFRTVAAHETRGIWAEDVLDSNRRVHLLDIDAVPGKPFGQIFGTRIFEYGAHTLTLVPPAYVKPTFADIVLAAHADPAVKPFRRSLAATIYGMGYLHESPTHVSGIKFARDLLPLLEFSEKRRD